MMNRIAWRLLEVMSPVLPRGLCASIKFQQIHGYYPSVATPRTFNEHIHVRKLFERDERFVLYADKLLVKDIMRRELGEQWVIPTVWSGTSLPEQFPGWPLPFVLKANFGSNRNRFVRSLADLDWTELRRTTAEWMKMQWPAANNENWYNAIPRRLLVEPMLSGVGGDLPDYKFFVFGGQVSYIQVDTKRHTDHRRTFFSPDWKRQDFSCGFPIDERDTPPPMHLAEMLEAASRIGAPFTFARVDLYDLPDGPKFGEITFTPARGQKRFVPEDMDLKLGSLWSAAIERATAPN